MTRFYLIRHGETEWNRELVFRGRADIPLSEHGRQQAARLAEALAGEPLAAVYSSPLSRAVETAKPVAARLGREVRESEALLDMDFGEWEGRAVAEVEARWPEAFRQWADRPGEFTPPGGEGLRAIRDRSKTGLEKWTAQHPEETIALVTHRVVCKVMLLEALGLDNSAFWRIQQDVCCLNLFAAQDGKYVIYRVNDTCHLRETGAQPGADF